MNVAIIPARGGSRRIPRKNIRPFFGRPIIEYSIEAAQLSGLFDEIVVSTDDDEIGTIAIGLGAGVHTRQPDDGTRGTQEVTQQVLREINADHEYACCIYPCAPLMLQWDLIAGYARLRQGGCGFVLVPGWFYWGQAEWFIENRGFVDAWQMHVGPRAIDINTESDWQRAEAMYAALHPEASA